MKTIELTVRVFGEVKDDFEIKDPDSVFLNIPLEKLELMQGMPVNSSPKKVEAKFHEYETVLAEITEGKEKEFEAWISKAGLGLFQN